MLDLTTPKQLAIGDVEVIGVAERVEGHTLIIRDAVLLVRIQDPHHPSKVITRFVPATQDPNMILEVWNPGNVLVSDLRDDQRRDYEGAVRTLRARASGLVVPDHVGGVID